jgi:hypothetical protein
VPRRRKKKNSTSSSQVTQCRNSLNVILDISTDCVSQWDSCRLSTASGEGKCLLLGYMLQGLDCQFSESEWWLPPLWGQPLARSCARKRMRTRIKKMSRRGDAIAGNLKLFAWAGLWIKIFGTKKDEWQLWRCEWPSAAFHHCWGMYCFAFCSVWGLYCEWFFIFQMSADPIILCTSQFASPTQVSDNTIASTTTDWGKRLTSIELFHLKMSWSHFTCFAMNFYKRMDSPTRFDFCEYRCWYPAEVSYILEPSIFVDTGTQYLLVSWILEPSIPVLILASD